MARELDRVILSGSRLVPPLIAFAIATACTTDKPTAPTDRLNLFKNVTTLTMDHLGGSAGGQDSLRPMERQRRRVHGGPYQTVAIEVSHAGRLSDKVVKCRQAPTGAC